VKDWLTVIIVLLIVGIVLDGLRRVRLAKRENIRVSKNARKADLEEDVPVGGSEFPSGGARVAVRRDEQDAQDLNQTVKDSFQAKRVTRGVAQKIPEQVSLNLEETVPMLMDSVDVEPNVDEVNTPDTQSFPIEGEGEPQLGSLDNLQDVIEEPLAEHDHSSAESQSESPSTSTATSRATKGEVEPEPESDEDTRYAEPDEVLIVNVMARAGTRFAGEDLLNALMAQQLKFGEMDIFHRHLDDDGDGPVLFSLANMIVPGTFNLSAMDSFETPGVSMFLSLPVAGESLAAYDNLIGTAQSLAQALGADLKDENRSVMTNQTIEHGRQRVIEYERKKKLARV